MKKKKQKKERKKNIFFFSTENFQFLKLKNLFIVWVSFRKGVNSPGLSLFSVSLTLLSLSEELSTSSGAAINIGEVISYEII